jgi:protein O-mannosyl-transferase
MSSQKCLAIVLLLILGVYARSACNEYSYDDRHYVMAPAEGGHPNTMVATWQGFVAYYTTPYGKDVSAPTRNLRPTVVMSFALLHQIDDGPAVQHVVNIGLHLLATCLVYLLLLRLFYDPWPAILGAAVFGLHALRSDQVIAAVGRSEILALVFGALGLLMFLTAMEESGRRRVCWLSGVALSLFLCFGAKESALAWVVFIPLFALACRWQREGPAIPIGTFLRSHVWPWLGAIVVPAILFGCLLYSVLAKSDVYIETINNPIVRADAAVRIGTGVMVLGHALFQILFPFWLHADYSYRSFEIVTSLADLRFLIPLVIMVAALVAGLRHARRQPALFLAVAVFFGFSFASSNVAVPIASIYGERHMYTPGLALCFAVAWGLSRLRAKGAGLPTGLAVVGGIWLLASCVVIVLRCNTWADDKTLFEHEAHGQPLSIRMQLAAGRQFREPAERAGLLRPEGVTLRKRWKYYLDRAIAIDPEHPVALTNLAYYHARLAKDMRARGAITEARAEESQADAAYQRALESPSYEDFYGRNIYPQIARLAKLRHDPVTRLRSLRKARELDPDSRRVCLELGRFYLDTGAPKVALGILQKGLYKNVNAHDLRYAALEAASRSEDYRTYTKLLEAGEPLQRQSAELAVYRAILHVRRGLFRPARELFDAAIPVLQRAGQPLPVASLSAYPRSLLEVGQTSRAKEFVNEHINDKRLTKSQRAEMLKLAKRLR